MKRKVTLPECNCTREQHVINDSASSIATEAPALSLCSEHSGNRGYHQKVVSFSYFGDEESELSQTRGYLRHIKTNLEAIKEFYPGWTIRIYHDIPKGDKRRMDFMCDLACTNPELDMCAVEDIPNLGNVKHMYPIAWRFLAMLDPMVDLMLSRDLDTVISHREVVAVEKWLDSKKSCHIIRDHPFHFFPIMGGTFGVQKFSKEDFDMIESTFWLAMTDPLFWAPYHSYGHDQILLKKYFWPWFKIHNLSHDAYHCEKFPHTKPFVTKRPSTPRNYIGGKIAENITLDVPCPYACRFDPTWMFC